MGMYEVVRLTKKGKEGKRIAYVNAKSKKKAAMFGMKKGKTHNVRVFGVKYGKGKKVGARAKIYNLK